MTGLRQFARQAARDVADAAEWFAEGAGGSPLARRLPCRRGTAARFRFTLGGCLGCGKLRRMDAIDPAAAKLALLTPEERDARTNEFLASEEFIPIVLECFAQAVRVAAAENAALGLTEQRFG